MSPPAKVFLLESPNALDLLEDRGERYSLEHVCKLFGHRAVSFLVRSSSELRQTLMYLSSIGWHKDAGKAPVFVHISVHGNSDGICVGPDDISWTDFADMISGMYNDLKRYKGPIILIISACGANKQNFTDLITKNHEDKKIKRPPQYVFVFSDKKVFWQDAVVTWTIFYREVNKLQFRKRKQGEGTGTSKQDSECWFRTIDLFSMEHE